MKDAVYRFWNRHLRHKAARWGSPLMANGTLSFHRAQACAHPFSCYMVYRSCNAALVRCLIRSAPEGSRFALHALDAVPSDLEPWTLRAGKGARMPLLNQLIEDAPPGELPVLICDDDVSFVADGIGLFVGLSLAAGADVAQPAHARGGFSTFVVTQVDVPSTARLVRFIESGPVVFLAPSAAARLLPFPEDIRMGWGVDVWWSAMQQPPLTLAVIDATPIIHRGEVGAEYDDGLEQEVLDAYLLRAGIPSAHCLDTNVGLTSRPWQKRAKWLPEARGLEPV